MSHPATKEEKNLAVIMHLSPLMGVIFPILGFIVPIGIWYLKKDTSPYIRARGKEILNFLLTNLIATAVSFVLMFIFVGYLMIACLIGYVVVTSILSAIKTSEGEEYRYPFILRLIQ